MSQDQKNKVFKPLTKVWVGLGGNLGDVTKTLHAALYRMQASEELAKLQASSLYRTAPIDAGGDDYINAVASFETVLDPLPLLRFLQSIEQLYGRERPYWHAPRTLDLDLLMYGDLVLNTPDLILPHPRLHERAFVLVPLAELDGQLLIPGHGAVQTLLPAVREQDIERLSPILLK